jgi:hypothetical protein
VRLGLIKTNVIREPFLETKSTLSAFVFLTSWLVRPTICSVLKHDLYTDWTVPGAVPGSFVILVCGSVNW